MKVPFLTFEDQYLETKTALDDALMNAVLGFSYIRGKEVTGFEQDWARLLGISHVISTGNCTDALFIALKTLGIQPGDEVITPAFSWISTSETISLCGATPVFADIDPLTYTLTPQQIKVKITPRTKAVITVHLYGQAAPATEIKTLCEKYKLYLIEDCAQAHLTEENGKYAGTIGDAGAFSFYPTKNLGALGDAGCLVTNDNKLAEKMRRFANHGALHKDDHLLEGMNSRMDTIQASVLLAKLPHLMEWTDKRRANAARYNSLLKDIEEVTLPYVRPGTTHTFHIYAIRTKKRDELRKFLSDKGVQTLIHYPVALPFLPPYDYLNHQPQDFPVASALQKEVLSLPIYPGLKTEQIDYVSQSIHDFFAAGNMG